MKLTDNWKTLIMESEIDDNNVNIISVRDDLKDFYDSKKMKFLIHLDLHYDGDIKGFPKKDISNKIEIISELIRNTMEKDKLAICIIESIGDNVKSWSYVCRHLESFQNRLNKCLSDQEYIPLEIKAYQDLFWGEYQELLTMAIEQDED